MVKQKNNKKSKNINKKLKKRFFFLLIKNSIKKVNKNGFYKNLNL